MVEHWVKTGEIAERQGPFSERQLKQLADSGQLLPEHLVSLDDGTSWNIARQFPGLEFSSLVLELEESPEGEPQATSQKPDKYHAITSLVMGILSIVLTPTWIFCCACFPVIPGCAIGGIIIGITGLKKVKEGTGGGRGMALAGMICGIVGMSLFVISIAGAFFVGFLSERGVFDQWR
jgi:hypothetical protein